jgi:xanthine dehydrogenase accessory factor
MGAAMAVRSDGTTVGTIGGGDLERMMIQHALDAMEDGRVRRYHYDFSGGRDQNLVKACTGKTGFLIMPCLAPPHLIIFGAGHVGRALAPVALTAGFRVTVVDDRPGFPNRDDFPESIRLINGPFEESIESLPFDRSTYIVVVTYGHAQDERVVGPCLRRPWRYLGVIGSRSKVAQLHKNLGVDEESRRLLSRVHAPIGLRLGGRSPGEIAVAIAAELVNVRRQGEYPDMEGVAPRDSHMPSEPNEENRIK